MSAATEQGRKEFAARFGEHLTGLEPVLDESPREDGEDQQGADKYKENTLLLEQSDAFSSKSFFPC